MARHKVQPSTNKQEAAPTVSVGIQRIANEGLSQWQCFVLRTNDDRVIEKIVYQPDCKQSCIDYMINELLEKFVML